MVSVIKFALYGTLVEVQELHVSAASLERQQIFTKVTSSSLGSDRLGQAWTDQSLAGCGLRCKEKYGSRCQTFMYNSNTGLCTPGSFLKSGTFGAALAPSAAVGDLFAPFSCDTSDGFTHVISGTLAACIMASNFSLNYPEAHALCLHLGAHLFVSRSMQRFNLLPPMIKYVIGLTDIAEEGKFVWQDNGETIIESFKTSLFNSGEPNDIRGEDCVNVRVTGSNHIANDYPCDTFKHRFVCERSYIRY
ncbi:hypothetical protein RRG08_002114 [Elysia crispata]|uniref:C-type lectin domain-containing protein n=1 Tax=Elysia crispata TaxID=231223 RepID=A0AAE1CKC2_9GAST|nr:hypothetical protein RRG08_002114 [Elysia crispata]